MKETLLKQVKRFRLLAMLLAALCSYATAHAQLSSDEINEAILVEGSVPVRWTNDAEHPWYIDSDGDGYYLRTPEKEGDATFASTLSFSYTSSYPVEISYRWRHYAYNSGSLTLLIDGVETGKLSGYHWTDRVDENVYFLMLPAGAHTVQFVADSRNDYFSEDCFSGLRRLRVWECRELESACLTAGSLPLKFDNDPENMWITENGYIRSTSTPGTGGTSRISTTFSLGKASLFAFDWCESYNGGWRNVTNIYVDGVLFKSSERDYEWHSASLVLYPGEHVVEFENTHDEAYWYTYDGAYGAYTEIRNVRLDQNWYDVTLNTPGQLAVKLLQALGDKNLQDAELVKINGSMNEEDWATVRQLSGAKCFDLTGAALTEIPDEGMRGLSQLSSVILPAGIKRIGNYAFYETNFHQINVPASLEEIGWSVWSETPLQFVNFTPDSKLRKIGHSAFYSTRLMEFIMPDSVTEITRTGDEYNGGYWYDGYYDGWGAFVRCESLRKLHLSEGLTVVPQGVAYECRALEEVNIPSKATAIEKEAFSYTAIKHIAIPETVTKIGYWAFAYSGLESLEIPPYVESYGDSFAGECYNLKTVSLSSHVWDMVWWFSGCTSLESVTLPCATPPSIRENYYDPFAGVEKSQVTVYVPDFALEAFRADPYWYQFTDIRSSEEASVNNYWAIRGNLTLDAGHVIQGTPNLEMMEGGVLTLTDASSQKFTEIIFNTSESNPAAFMSQSNAVTANRVESRFKVEQPDRWYFFSPITDVRMSDVKYPATDSWVIRYYDGARRASENTTSGNWVNVPADGTLKAGQGYIVQAREAGWLYLPAVSSAEVSKMVGSNPVTFTLADNACETEANAGWNFVANPYPTFYDIYYIDMQAPITVWTGDTYRAYSLNDGDRGDDTFVLRPMQPFFVQKNAADLSTGMPLVGRQVSTAIDRSRAPRVESVDENRHKLNLELFREDKETADDYTRVVLNETASMAYETVRDASKFMTMNADVAQLYTLGADGHPMAINERPYEDGNVALGVLLPAAGRTYRIAARRADRKAWLYDAETGIEQDLTEGDYIFTAAKTGVDNKRFSIRFAPATNGVNGIGSEEVKVAGNVGFLSVKAPVDTEVAVYGADGRVIANAVMADGTIEIAVAAGVYVVKVNGESFKTIVK